jgi:hypothetical protein
MDFKRSQLLERLAYIYFIGIFPFPVG